MHVGVSHHIREIPVESFLCRQIGMSRKQAFWGQATWAWQPDSCFRLTGLVAMGVLTRPMETCCLLATVMSLGSSSVREGSHGRTGRWRCDSLLESLGRKAS